MRAPGAAPSSGCSPAWRSWPSRRTSSSSSPSLSRWRCGSAGMRRSRWRRSSAYLRRTAVYNTAQRQPADVLVSARLSVGRPARIASITYIPRAFGKLFLLNYTGPLLGIAATAALVVAWRRFPATRWLVVAQVVGFALFFSTLYYSISEFMLRFLTPALPGYALRPGARSSDGVRPARACRCRFSPPGRLSIAACGAA